jgi:6-phosphogluconolactonase
LAPPYKAKIDWQNVFVLGWRTLGASWWCQQPKMAYDCLLSHVDKKQHISMYKEGVPAEDYALDTKKLLKLLREGWKIWPCFIRNGRWWPYRFSFPGQAVLQERDKWVSAYYLESQSMFRIT